MTIPIEAWLAALGPAAGILLLLFTAVWAASLRLENVAIVDVLWGPAFLVAALVYRARGPEPGPAQLLGLVLLGAWALRLAAHLAIRAKGAPEDRRYAAMRERDPRFAWTSLFKIFWLQAALVLPISAPHLALQTAPALPIGPWVLLGGSIALAGLAIEAIADLQLHWFKADPSNRGRVLDRGLWRYSRHPNYFGDFCVWWGFWLLCLGAPGGLWTVPGPLLMSLLLLKVSGVTLLEKDIGDRRPEYRDYVRRTNAFFPWIPRGEGA